MRVVGVSEEKGRGAREKAALMEPITGSSESRLDVLCDISCLMVGSH